MTTTPRSPVTIRDVAQAAGVSTASVSSVINGRSRVSAQTTARILETIATLGYQINPTARNLRAGRTNAIGLVVPELNRPYFAQLSTLLADLIDRSGRHLVVQRSGGDREKELAAASFARFRMYDGVIISVVGLDPDDLKNLNFTTPVVLIGERPLHHTFDHVIMDNVGGAHQATTHLIERGARRIALLGGALPDQPASDMALFRTQGYADAHADVSLTPDPGLIIPLDSFGAEAGRAAVHDLVDRGIEFDAVFAVTDVVAMGAMRALADLGISIPDQVQVIGFDNVTESEFSIPSLTSIDPNKQAIATQVLELLDSRLNQAAIPAGTITADATGNDVAGNTGGRSAGNSNLKLAPPREITIPTTLVARESTRP